MNPEMELQELGSILNKMYSEALKGEAVTMIHLFGILYSKEIEALGSSATEIAKAATIQESYGTEIRKGVNLAKYVVVKKAHTIKNDA
jgi:5-methylcytosine-specific restriction protein B